MMKDNFGRTSTLDEEATVRSMGRVVLKDPSEHLHGEQEGHPFRGNQFGAGEGGSTSRSGDIKGPVQITKEEFERKTGTGKYDPKSDGGQKILTKIPAQRESAKLSDLQSIEEDAMNRKGAMMALGRPYPQFEIGWETGRLSMAKDLQQFDKNGVIPKDSEGKAQFIAERYKAEKAYRADNARLAADDDNTSGYLSGRMRVLTELGKGHSIAPEPNIKVTPMTTIHQGTGGPSEAAKKWERNGADSIDRVREETKERWGRK
jgi:hypothetical protein